MLLRLEAGEGQRGPSVSRVSSHAQGPYCVLTNATHTYLPPMLEFCVHVYVYTCLCVSVCVCMESRGQPWVSPLGMLSYPL